MRSDEPGLSAVWVDGQRLVVPDELRWAELEAVGMLDGRPLGVGRLLAQYRALAQRFEGLEVGLGEAREPGMPWIVYHLVVVHSAWVRVKVESQVCVGCGEGALTGIARHYNLYEGTEDPLAALRAAEAHPVSPCASCGSPFPQPAVCVLGAR